MLLEKSLLLRRKKTARLPRLFLRFDDEDRRRCNAAAFRSFATKRDNLAHRLSRRVNGEDLAVGRCGCPRQPFTMQPNDRAPRLSCQVKDEGRRRCLENTLVQRCCFSRVVDKDREGGVSAGVKVCGTGRETETERRGTEEPIAAEIRAAHLLRR